MIPPDLASPEKGHRIHYALILVAVLLALVLRLPQLSRRPMHTDEAVHAEKLRLLLEQGRYDYDPEEYHGPTLNYFTLIPARLSGANQFTEVTERTLRIVPVFFGVLLVLLLLLLFRGLGPTTTILAAFLTAVSPAMVYYSRYYIQEMLLVCFTFGAIACGYHYWQTRHILWAILTGVFLGLMHATKETCIVAFGCMLLALLLTLFAAHRSFTAVFNTLRTLRLTHLIAMAAVALAVSGLFCSSFLTNPRGSLDSFLTYKTYFDRAGASFHIHPWHYYLRMLLWFKFGDGPLWTEALIVLLAVVGCIAAIRGRRSSGHSVNLLRFIAFYTIAMTVVYSAVPYKTPWCVLGFLHGMILLAALGAVVLLRVVHRRVRTLVALVLICAFFHLSYQAYRGSYVFYADPRNPYVYAHTGTDIFNMVHRVEEIAAIHPADRKMPIHIICPGRDYWPFPWYLRNFQSVGYYESVTDNVISASVIIASASLEQELLNRLYLLPPPSQKQLYVPLFDTYMELRPTVELRGYLPKELWDLIQRGRTNPDKVPP